jgi:uncharacterized protein (DUF302 family)
MSADGTIKYSLQEPFERSVQSICCSLHNHGMRVVGVLDVSRRLERSLRMILAPCRIVFVLPAPAALSADSIHPWAAVFLPLHIVIWGNDSQSEIGITNMLRTGRNTGDSMPFGPIVEAQRQLIEAIEAIAVRPGVLA